MIRHRTRHDRVGERQGPETASEGDLVGGLEVLAGEEDDLVPQPQRPQGSDGGVVEGPAQVDARDLGPDGAAEGADGEPGGPVEGDGGRGSGLLLGKSDRFSQNFYRRPLWGGKPNLTFSIGFTKDLLPSGPGSLYISHYVHRNS